MAKVGYIFLAEAYESVESDKAWMEKFGCVKIVEENAEDEKLRPEWKALLMSLERGDELVLSKFSNALRGTRELSYFLELCRIKVIRIISIHDKVDSKDEVFPALKTSDFLDMIGSLLQKLPHSVRHLPILCGCVLPKPRQNQLNPVRNERLRL